MRTLGIFVVLLFISFHFFSEACLDFMVKHFIFSSLNYLKYQIHHLKKSVINFLNFLEWELFWHDFILSHSFKDAVIVICIGDTLGTKNVQGNCSKIWTILWQRFSIESLAEYH